MADIPNQLPCIKFTPKNAAYFRAKIVITCEPDIPPESNLTSFDSLGHDNSTESSLTSVVRLVQILYHLLKIVISIKLRCLFLKSETNFFIIWKLPEELETFFTVFGTSLTTYKRNKFQKRSTWSPTWLNRYSFETRAPAPFLYVLEAMKTPIFMFFRPYMSYLILSYVSNNAGNKIL